MPRRRERLLLAKKDEPRERRPPRLAQPLQSMREPRPLGLRLRQPIAQRSRPAGERAAPLLHRDDLGAQTLQFLPVLLSLGPGGLGGLGGGGALFLGGAQRTLQSRRIAPRARTLLSS